MGTASEALYLFELPDELGGRANEGKAEQANGAGYVTRRL